VLESLPNVAARGAVTTPGPMPAALLAVTDDVELRDLLLAERPGLVVVDLDMKSGAGGKFLRSLRRSPHRAIPCMGVTGTNDMMISVAIDAPVFFKPTLTGFTDALHALFDPPAPPPSTLVTTKAT
jgi:CheY-like chemotaxis protein